MTDQKTKVSGTGIAGAMDYVPHTPGRNEKGERVCWTCGGPLKSGFGARIGPPLQEVCSEKCSNAPGWKRQNTA